MLREFLTNSKLLYCLGVFGILISIILSFLWQHYIPRYLLIYVFISLILAIILSLYSLKEYNSLSEEIPKEDTDIENTDNLEKRLKIILNEANLVFNRLENNISNLKSRSSTFLAIIIATLGFLISLLQIFYSMNNNLTNLQLILFLLPFIILILISIILLFRLIWTTTYYEIELFRKERFKEILNAENLDVLLDFLFFIRKFYTNNYEIFNRHTFIYRYVLIFFLVGIIYLLMGMCIIYIN